MTSNQFLSNDSVAVIGIMHRHQVYLYDAAEFRPPLDGEVWCMEGTHWTRSIFTWKGRRHVTLSQVDIEVSNAHNANRYWPGDEAMVQRELDATADAFLAGAQ
jgi:hypothetical protein